MNLKHTTVQTNGINLHVAQAGQESDPLVILLHGFPEFWYGWRHQITALAETGYWVWVPDQRGYNLSEKPPGIAAYNLNELALDVSGLIKAAGRERCCLIGHDWGGAVAWWVANKYPEMLEKLVVLNVPHHRVFSKALNTNREQRRRSRYMFFFQIPFFPDFLLGLGNGRLLARLLRKTSRPGTFSEEELQQYRAAWKQPGAITAMLNWYRAAFKARPKLPEDRRIHVPTLLIWGWRDGAFSRETIQPSIDLCDQGRLEILEAATHWVAAEEPARVNTLILEFLRGE